MGRVPSALAVNALLGSCQPLGVSTKRFCRRYDDAAMAPGLWSASKASLVLGSAMADTDSLVMTAEPRELPRPTFRASLSQVLLPTAAVSGTCLDGLGAHQYARVDMFRGRLWYPERPAQRTALTSWDLAIPINSAVVVQRLRPGDIRPKTDRTAFSSPRFRLRRDSYGLSARAPKRGKLHERRKTWEGPPCTDATSATACVSESRGTLVV
jgi:hypothetical protein